MQISLFLAAGDKQPGYWWAVAGIIGEVLTGLGAISGVAFYILSGDLIRVKAQEDQQGHVRVTVRNAGRLPTEVSFIGIGTRRRRRLRRCFFRSHRALSLNPPLEKDLSGDPVAIDARTSRVWNLYRSPRRRANWTYAQEAHFSEKDDRQKEYVIKDLSDRPIRAIVIWHGRLRSARIKRENDPTVSLPPSGHLEKGLSRIHDLFDWLAESASRIRSDNIFAGTFARLNGHVSSGRRTDEDEVDAGDGFAVAEGDDRAGGHAGGSEEASGEQEGPPASRTF